ncbi:hypothetical protein HN51_019624, partial [Arachis hypogaea]
WQLLILYYRKSSTSYRTRTEHTYSRARTDPSTGTIARKAGIVAPIIPSPKQSIAIKPAPVRPPTYIRPHNSKKPPKDYKEAATNSPKHHQASFNEQPINKT